MVNDIHLSSMDVHIICNGATYADLDKLKLVLKRYGLEHCLPKMRTEYAYTKDAVAEEFGKGFEVNGCKLNGYDVKRVRKHAARVDKTREAILMLRNKYKGCGAGGTTLFVKEYNGVGLKRDLAARIAGRIDTHKRRIDCTGIGQMVKAIVVHLNGICLKEGVGGCYRVDYQHIDMLRKLAADIDTASIQGSTRFTCFEVKRTADSVQHMLDCFLRETRTELARIQEDLKMDRRKGELKKPGERALTARKRELDDMRSRIREYEGVLGMALPQLVTELEDVETERATVELCDVADLLRQGHGVKGEDDDS